MHQWIDEEIDRTNQAIAAVQAEIATQIAVIESIDVANPELVPARAKLLDLKNRLVSEESNLLGYHRAEPWIKKLVPSDPFSTIAVIVTALMISTLIKHFFLVSNEYLVGRVALDITRNIRMQIFDKALGMDREIYSSYGTSTFTASIAHTTEMLSNGLINALGAALREPLKVISCLVGAGLICWRLLLLSVLVAPLVGIMLFYVTRKLRQVAFTQLSKAEGYHEVMLESLGNINTVQTYRMEAVESKRFGESTMAMRNCGIKFIFYSSLSKPIIEFLGLGMLGTTIIGGAYIVLNQETQILGIPICEEPLSVSALLIFFGMLIGISDPLRKLSAVYGSINAACMAADGLYPILDRANQIRDPAEPKHVPRPHRMLEIGDVEFAYNPGQPVLSNVSLSVPFGSTVAIVGHNGSGKSTMIHLLGRFYDPQQGSLRLDDVDFRDMAVEDVRNRIALVTQHTELFNNTVAYNIRYGKPDATEEEVLAAAREAHAHEFIMSSLPQGYETYVGQNGCRLSGGQRQRIALARALLCDPEILILDEATSQIDMRSEQLLRESLAKHRGERTMIIITHREKLLELADRAFEVVEGKLIERPNLLCKAA